MGFSVKASLRYLAALAVVVALAMPGLPAQADTPDTASISGHISAQPGVEISRVVVEVFRSVDMQPWGSASVAADGSYTARGLRAGSYVVRASGHKSGGYDNWYGGALQETATPVTVQAGQALQRVDIAVPLGGTITGKIIIPPGFLMKNLSVSAFGENFHSGGTIMFSFVDDQGNYSLSGLAPDSYIISAYSDEPLETNSYGRGGYYNPSKISIAATEKIAGIDISLSKSSSISGKLTLPAGASTGGLAVSARTSDGNLTGRGAILPDGSFRITHLSPGDFRIKVETGSSGIVDQWYSDAADAGSAKSIHLPASTDIDGINMTLVLAPAFNDISPKTAFSSDIEWMAARGVAEGFEDGTYRPLDVIHRDAMAAFIYRAAGKPEFTTPADSPFKDVAVTDPFYKEITWLKSQGITTGYPDGTYRPLGSINRDAMAAFLYRLANRVGCIRPEAEIPVFRDNPVSAPFHEEIKWLGCFGISTGYADGTFKPDDPVHRDAMAAFIKRLSVQPGYPALQR